MSKIGAQRSTSCYDLNHYENQTNMSTKNNNMTQRRSIQYPVSNASASCTIFLK